MIKILIPILDHLYIFQALEYEPITFLKWFVTYPFKRNLQRKHKLILTPKALVILILALFLEITESLYLSQTLISSFWASPLIFLLLQLIGPIYLVIAWIIFYPFESYQKNQILKKAKQKLANLPNLKVVAITGSFAKTSTKDILYTLLWKDLRVVKTPKSYNTEVSIARSILADLKDNTEIFLVEMDAYHRGDIKKLSSLAKPDLAIITAIAPQHLERFGSMETLAKTQFEITENLKEDGLLILNSQNEWTMKLEEGYELNKCFIGEREEDLFQAKKIKNTPNGTEFELKNPLGQTKINLPLIGTHHITNFLLATAVAQSLGLSLNQINQRATQILPTSHRLEIRKSGQVTLIDNTYNTNPLASRASLDVLKVYPGKLKILITPGLVELGKEHYKENKAFATEAAKVADLIIIVGKNAKKPLMQGLKEAEFNKEKIIQTKTTKEALNMLPSLTQGETVVLLENDLPDQYF
jgi:UDP-N-acetylmuramoyl-tripeptide--D-alanyl-D-alanine ligase